MKRTLSEYSEELRDFINKQVIEIFNDNTGLDFEKDVHPECDSLINSTAFFELNKNVIDKIPDEFKVYSYFLVAIHVILACTQKVIIAANILLRPLIGEITNHIQEAELKEKFDNSAEVN